MLNEKLYTVSDLAEYLGMNPTVIRRKAGKGDLSGYKIGKEWRFNESHIADFMKKCEKKAKE